MTSGWQRIRLLVLCAALLNACDQGSPTAGIDRGGVRMPVTVQGVITGFGSIIVNGVHYDITHADIRINGAAGSDADLQIGQLVTVSGERDEGGSTGVAATVGFEANVRGPVESVDPTGVSLLVLGQLVSVNASTVIDFAGNPPALAALQRGDRVEVSGFVAAHGAIDATRIKLVSRSADLRVVGVVGNVDTAGARFNINDLVVDYHAALSIEGFAAGQPANGDRVIAKGRELSPTGELVALELKLAEDAFQRTEGHGSEVEGLITRFVSPTDFDVAGVQATTNSSTVYEGGSEASLALNVKVEIEGSRDSIGVLVARKIEIKDGGQVFSHDH
jgi:hypothetical protein